MRCADAPTVSAAFAFAFPLAAAARPRFFVGKTSVTFAVVGMLSCASEVSALAVVPKVVVVRREWHPRRITSTHGMPTCDARRETGKKDEDRLDLNPGFLN